MDMDQQPASKKRETIAALAVLIVIVAVVTAATMSAHKQTSDDVATVVSTPVTSDAKAVTTPDTTSADTTNASGNTAATSTYKDGSYTTVGSYDSPDGTELITIHVTLQNDIVTETSAEAGAHDPEGKEYQADFIGGYKQLVVGKDIDSIRLHRVSGSSLTSQGFNSALGKIKKQAKQSA